MKVILKITMLTAIFAIAVFSCKKKEDKPTTVSVAEVTLNKTTLSLEVSKSETLTANVKPDNAANKAVTWKSSDATIASVDASGKVTAVKAGTATITATTTDGGKTANCTVTVTAASVEPPAAITVENEEALEQAFFADEDPATISFKTEGAWTSSISEGTAKSDVSWISITPDHGDEAGDYTVIINAEPNATGAKREATIFITCKVETISISLLQKESRAHGELEPFVAVTNITDVPTTATAGTPLTLTGTVAPADATNQTIVWSIEDAGGTGATISDNTLNTTAAGTAIVRATIVSGLRVNRDYRKNFTITVNAGFVAVTDITNIPTWTEVETLLTLTGTVVPANATNQAIEWSIDDAGTTGATLSGNTLNTTAAGTVIVQATIVNGATPTTDYRRSFYIRVPVSFDGGEGTEKEPYLVANAAQLNAVRYYNSAAAHFRQIANITLSETWAPIEDGSAFNGIYDGGGYSINNLNIHSQTYDQQGLFQYIHPDGVVKNVALINVNISSLGTHAGGIAGGNYGTIENCYVTGTVSGTQYVGGIAGYNSDGEIKNCYTTCNVTGSGNQIGGITGINNGTVQYCYATGKISGTTLVGGIVGQNIGFAVDHCVALNSEVMATDATDAGGAVGRVVGNNSGTLTYNYARAAGMTLKGNGVIVTPTETTLSGIDGADVIEANTHGANSDTWWSGTAGFSTYAWSFAAERLPHLLTTGATPFNQTQDPTVQ